VRRATLVRLEKCLLLTDSKTRGKEDHFPAPGWLCYTWPHVHNAQHQHRFG
jgi:hypothetical protein